MFNFGSKTYIMGILNVTPDSFSDGGDFTEIDSAVNRAIKMKQEGADIIDIGAESTRPGSIEVDEETEIKRLIPVISEISKSGDLLISVDTYKAKVAELALDNGAKIINDVWGLQRDKDMARVAAERNCPVIVMHNQIEAIYKKDIMESIKDFFHETMDIAFKAGIKRENLIIDPGLGFGKTSEHNIEIMGRLSELKELNFPILLGASRKSMLGKILDLPPKERVEGTIATTVIGIMQGVDIVRVHDVKENLRASMVADAIYRRKV
ncbi:dihydropteroate synthase [Acetoanaerobium pronyense]|uniref:Dihydropteroate synthase n=1 Tax=Acetoanaerobium pronyense TaxID=1482736 RepID=A0ABS4KF41_9FIRM|nr:dihydropteroate synthase [Acetoanaerobium pronyense]MBP2026375.1 dihydropteroate synthase [Acetoanaerobium pronyense]